MKANNMIWLRLALMLLTILALCDKCYPNYCECTFHAGGCTISKAAPSGFKCKCNHDGFWGCYDRAFPCVGEEQCPGNQADYCACQLTNSNCGGYYNPPKTCAGSGRPKPNVARSANCDCEWSRGGCTIHTPAPFGWKCACLFKGFWHCTGWAQQCDANEICPGEDYSYCGCKQGGGNCGAYPNKPSCPSHHVSTVCNCNRATDWKEGLYTISKVTYDFNNIQTHSMKPIALAEKNIFNPSRVIQSIEFAVQESRASTSSFSRTKGISIQVGQKFTAGIPDIAASETSISVTNNFEHTFGKTESNESSIKTTFTCNGVPHKHTKCTVLTNKAKVTVPYTMMIKHKVIDSCVCKSNGVWTGVQGYNSQLITKVMENIN